MFELRANLKTIDRVVLYNIACLYVVHKFRYLLFCFKIGLKVHALYKLETLKLENNLRNGFYKLYMDFSGI